MRLTAHETESIKSAVIERDPAAGVYIFGSRTDDTKKGGDIDVLIISDRIDFNARRDIRLDLYRKIGDQKIDIVIYKNEDTSNFKNLALLEAVKL